MAEILIAPLLNERGRTHGAYNDTARIAQELKRILRKSPDYATLPDVQRESLDMICTKIARVLCGDYACEDHWKDIAGYATLVIQLVEEGKIDALVRA